MSISLSHWRRLEEFPITRTKVFLAHAAISPFSRCVCEAIQDYCQSNSSFGQWEYLYGETERKTREYAAGLFGGSAEEVAFVSSTSMGLGIVAAGLPWKAGDNVIVADGDFPSNIYPWLNLARLGVETRFIPRRADGAVRVDDVSRLADYNTRLVSLSSVNYITGYRIDLNAIGEYLDQKGILFCVDAVQGLGALPMESGYVDFAASSSHKWLMGPLGIGILYVKKERLETLRPALVGWKTVKDNKKYLDYRLDFPASAKRYEMGSLNGLGLMGLHAALQMLAEAGIVDIGARILKLRRLMVEPLLEMGYTVYSAEDGERGSGIISFTRDRQDMAGLRQHLDRRGFVVSLREGLDGRKCIRVAPHFYNTEDEIRGLLFELRAYQRSQTPVESAPARAAS